MAKGVWPTNSRRVSRGAVHPDHTGVLRRGILQWLVPPYSGRSPPPAVTSGIAETPRVESPADLPCSIKLFPLQPPAIPAANAILAALDCRVPRLMVARQDCPAPSHSSCQSTRAWLRTRLSAPRTGLEMVDDDRRLSSSAAALAFHGSTRRRLNNSVARVARRSCRLVTCGSVATPQLERELGMTHRR